MKKIVALFIRIGVVPLTLLSLGACSGQTATQGTETSSPSPSIMASTMSSPSSSSPMPMDHNSMMHMDLGPADQEFDLRFMDAMTPHHQGAVVMAKEAQQKSKRAEIQTLATNIIKAQDTEINQMKRWRQAWYPKASAEPVAYNSQMGHSMPMSQSQMQGMMMNMNLGAADSQFDLRFINAMIPHHQSAVVMAKDALSKSKRPEIQRLAQDIVASQDAEIKQMQQWKQAWYKP